MKKICTLLLCAGMLLGATASANAIDFKARGLWEFAFGMVDYKLLHKTRNGDKKSTYLKDEFNADQRVRLYLDAVASENLSGTVGFEIGTQNWGQTADGAALGADGIQVKVKHAYIDWMMPELPLRIRMGIQPFTMPNAAGGSAVMDGDAAGIMANYQVNDNIGVTFGWMRPENDNYTDPNNSNRNGYLDNLDLFTLSVPLHFDGIEVTPWAMLGMRGANSLKGDLNSEDYIAEDGTVKTRKWFSGTDTKDGNLPYTLLPYAAIANGPYGDYSLYGVGKTGKAYGTLFWAGLPIKVSLFDPLNIEFDVNYGYSEPMGRYDATKMHADGTLETKRSSTLRQGWVLKALVEYKMDWGTPGILGWYATGDDNNPKNGSERMPSIVPCPAFTSFMGDGGGWPYNDFSLDFAGTWGIGLQISDMSFIDNLSTTFRAVYWGGTNSPSMAKYMQNSYSWYDGWWSNSNPYLTTNDGLLEFNLVNSYQMYENLQCQLELGYIANYMDNDTWKKAGSRDSSFSKQDAWKAQLVFRYSF